MAVFLYLKVDWAPWYIAYVLLFNVLVGPVFTAGSVTGERERQTLEMLLTTGYLPVSTSRSSSPLDDTSIADLMNNGTTQALLRLQPIVNAKAYQVQTSIDGGKTWVEAILSSQARRIVLVNLVPGTTYAVRARAIGGSTGASSWTLAQSIMST